MARRLDETELSLPAGFDVTVASLANAFINMGEEHRVMILSTDVETLPNLNVLVW